jgi:hypothetical protein
MAASRRQPERRLAQVLTGLDGAAAAAAQQTKTVTLDNGAIAVDVALRGGFILSVAPSGNEGANPLTNRHFICCDRWGPASKSEQEEGMTWHGEAMRELWTLDGESSSSTEATMTVALPMAGLTVTRRLKLLGDSPMVLVEEDITNTNALGRVYNLVQHPTLGAYPVRATNPARQAYAPGLPCIILHCDSLHSCLITAALLHYCTMYRRASTHTITSCVWFRSGPPFLDEHTVVDSNATTGFAQAPRVSPGEPNVELPVSAEDRQYFTFPQTSNPSGTATQIRTMEGAQDDDVASCEPASQPPTHPASKPASQQASRLETSLLGSSPQWLLPLSLLLLTLETSAVLSCASAAQTRTGGRGQTSFRTEQALDGARRPPRRTSSCWVTFGPLQTTHGSLCTDLSLTERLRREASSLALQGFISRSKC